MKDTQQLQEIFEHQDLGKTTVEKVCQAVKGNDLSTLDDLDILTKYITDAYLDAEDEDDYNSFINYSIQQLKLAKL